MIVVIDDKKIFLDEWREVLSKEKVPFLLFCHPLEFLSFCEQNPQTIGTIEILVTDQKTPGFDALETDFINAFREKHLQFEGIALLCSSLFDPKNTSLAAYGYAGTIPKRASTYSELIATYGGEQW